MFLYILIGLATLLLFYLGLIKPHNYWKDRGVKHEKPLFLFGNLISTVLMTKCFVYVMDEWYNLFKNERYFGIYQSLAPVLVIKDPELIKDIGIKDFNHFRDHQAFSSESDAMWSKNLFALKGDKWKEMRTTLSPSFTAIKMRVMFSLINDCTKQLISHLLAKKENAIEIEAKDFFTRFTNDVIATSAFGVTCDSFKNPDNEFYKKGNEATDFSGIKGLKFFMYAVSPTLSKWLGIKLVSGESAEFFQNIVAETVKLREEQGVVRPDMIHLLMEAKKQREKEDNQKTEITIEDMTAQAFIFFTAGFDTASTLMMYIAYELATNKDVQEKLIEEIDAASVNGDLTYETVSSLKYLDMVVSETLRLWPPTLITDRTCTSDYTIEPKKDGEQKIVVEKGSFLWIPIYSLHRDPNYFSEPNKFKPERFSDGNKESIIPGTYLPFGIGPRLCIGNRFALMETKAIIYYLLLNFEFVTVDKSVVPVKLSKKHFNLNAENGMWLGLKKRDK